MSLLQTKMFHLALKVVCHSLSGITLACRIMHADLVHHSISVYGTHCLSWGCVVYLTALKNCTCGIWLTRSYRWELFCRLRGRKQDATDGTHRFCLGGPVQCTKTRQEHSEHQLPLLIHWHMIPHRLELRSQKENHHTHRQTHNQLHWRDEYTHQT